KQPSARSITAPPRRNRKRPTTHFRTGTLANVDAKAATAICSSPSRLRIETAFGTAIGTAERHAGQIVSVSVKAVWQLRHRILRKPSRLEAAAGSTERLLATADPRICFAKSFTGCNGGAEAGRPGRAFLSRLNHSLLLARVLPGSGHESA